MATVIVRIAVAVDPKGAWSSCGWSTATSDDELMGNACDALDTGERRYWLAAELEIPESQEVAATIEKAE